MIKQYGGCDGIRESPPLSRASAPPVHPLATVVQSPPWLSRDSSLSVSWVVWAYCVFAIVA